MREQVKLDASVGDNRLQSAALLSVEQPLGFTKLVKERQKVNSFLGQTKVEDLTHTQMNLIRVLSFDTS